MANDVTLEIYSEDGGVQVLGDGGITFGLSHADSVVLTDDGANHPQPMVTAAVTVTGTNPVFAFKANGNINVDRVTVSGSTFTFRLRAQSSQPIGLQYWIFDTAAAAAKDPSMADIEAAFYDQYGVKTFDAAASMMRAVDVINTGSPPEDIPHGYADLAALSEYEQPQGRVYAVVQSTGAIAMTQYDTGAYSYSQFPPGGPEIGDGSEPGPGARWRYQRLES